MAETVISGHHHAHGPANRRRRVLQTAAPLFVRHPRSEAKAAVIVLHDMYGLTEQVENDCRALAGSGYLAVAPYLYYDSGGKEFRPEAEITARAAMSLLLAADLAADLAGALDYLRQRAGIAPQRTGVLGRGMGGYLASWAAAEHELAAAVAFDPVSAGPWQELPVLTSLVSELRTPWLGIAPQEEAGALTAAGSRSLAVILTASPEENLGSWDEATRFFDGHLLT